MSWLNERNIEFEKRRSYVKTANKLNFDRKNAPYYKASAFDLCVAPTTQKCDWLMLDSSESDDRPKLTGR